LRLYGAVLIGAVPVAVLGTIDVRWRSRLYYVALRSQVIHLYLAMIASIVISLLLVLLWPRLPRARDWVLARRAGISTVACWIVGGLLILAWSLRPAIEHPVGTTTPLGTLEKAEGLTISAYRTLSEQSLVWISWYIGPVALTLAIAGVCVLVARTIRSGAWAPFVVLLMAGGVTAIYIDNPSISPDQIFAMRRFVPGVLPLFVLAAAVAVELVAVTAMRLLKSATWPRNVIVAGSLALVAFPLATTWPVAKFQPQANYLGTVDQTCATIGKNAAVIFPWDDIDRLTMPQTIRTFCNVPAASLTSAATDAQIRQIAAVWKAQGRTLWVLASSPATLLQAAPAAQPAAIATATSPRELEATVAYAPQAYTTATLPMYGAKVLP
jgi:hypothetical protein